MDLYFRKLVLFIILEFAYLAVCFWVPFSKKWLMDDIIHNQARLYFATQSSSRLKDKIVSKAESLEIPLEPDQVSVQNINSEIIYIELDLNIPYNILMFESSLHFQPKVFGLIRGFNTAGGAGDTQGENVDRALATLSDSTREYLQTKTLKNYFNEFFAY